MDFMALMDELRKAVERDGRTHAAIAGGAGIHVKTFSAFMHGRRGLSHETVERLTKTLGVTVKLVRAK